VIPSFLSASIDDLNFNMRLSLADVLAHAYGEGFVKAAEAAGRFAEPTGADVEVLREALERTLSPIRDYNNALADKINSIVENELAAGKDYREISDKLRATIPSLISKEPIIIQRPGKRPVAFTPKSYAQLIGDVVPYSVRHAGYLSEIENVGGDGWQWIAADDERTCTLCGELHLQIFTFEDDYPPAHPRCRCRPVAYFDPEKQKERAPEEEDPKIDYEDVDASRFYDMVEDQTTQLVGLSDGETRLLKDDWFTERNSLNQQLAESHITDPLEAADQKARQITQILDKFELNQDVRAWRGINNEILEKMPDQAFQVGKTIKNQTILSTTIKSRADALKYAVGYGKGEKPVILEIFLPSDSHGLLADAILNPEKNFMAGTKELLISPSNFRVIGYEETPKYFVVKWSAITEKNPNPKIILDAKNIAQKLLSDLTGATILG